MNAEQVFHGKGDSQRQQDFDAAVCLWGIYKSESKLKLILSDFDLSRSIWPSAWAKCFLPEGPVTCSIVGAEVVKRQPCLHISCTDKHGQIHLQYIPRNHSALPAPVRDAARLLFQGPRERKD